MSTTDIDHLTHVFADKLAELGYITAPDAVELIAGDSIAEVPWRLVWDSDTVEFPLSMALGFMGVLGHSIDEALRTLHILITSLTMVDLERDHMRDMLCTIAALPDEQLGVWRMLALDKANPDDAIAAADALGDAS